MREKVYAHPWEAYCVQQPALVVDNDDRYPLLIDHLKPAVINSKIHVL